MSTFETIDTAQLRLAQEKEDAPHVWNVLTDDYFTGELIPGSRRVPLGRVVREARALGLDEDAEIVVYCAGPDCPQSEAAATKLAELGFRSVKDYDGGLEAWKEAGLPVRTPAEEAAA